MRYFKYVRKKDPVLTLRVHQAVRRCVGLAKKTYRSRWEDALDDAYFHILDNYDVAKGELESYAISVVGTIYLNKYPREVGSDVVFDIESDKYAIEQYSQFNPFDSLLQKEEDVEYNSQLDECIRYLLPFFIKDYKFFVSKDSAERKCGYKELFEKFPPGIIHDAFIFLSERYSNEAEYLCNLSKGCHARSFSDDRYKNSLDKTLQYICQIGDCICCKTISVRRKKYAYKLDIRDLFNKIYRMFYEIDGVARRVIHTNVIYCSLSGKLLFDKDELADALENEIIGAILALRTNLKVIHYLPHNEIIFSSTKEDEPNISLNLFKTGVPIPLQRLTISRQD